MIKQLLAHFRQRSIPLSPEQLARLELLKSKTGKSCKVDPASDRVVVVDVETSGLSLVDDHLIAIGAIAINAGRVVYSDSFYILLRQDTASDKSNILVHEIGGTAQRTGLPPDEALLSFLEYLDGAPLFAFHAAFDETMLRKACRKFLGFEFRHAWADLAYLLPSLFPEYAHRYHSLDDWLGHFSIANDARHNALADAQATAQLCQIAIHSAQTKRSMSFKTLQEMEKIQRWLRAI